MSSVAFLSVIYYLLSPYLFIERDPVGAEGVGEGGFAFRESFFDTAISITVPGIVPATAHVEIEGMGDLVADEVVHKGFIAHAVLGLYDAQTTFLLTKGTEDVATCFHLGGEGTCLAILDNEQLTESHGPIAC